MAQDAVMYSRICGSNPIWRAKSSLTKRTGMLIKNECEHGRLLLRQAESLKGN